MPASVAYVGYRAGQGGLSFGTAPAVTLLLVGAGAVTIGPLLTYTMSLRRLPLLAITCIQILSPTMQFLVAIFWNGERPAWPMWFALGCVWAAVGIFLADALGRVRRPSAAVPTSVARPARRLLR